jgi:leucyl aminopeptidase
MPLLQFVDEKVQWMHIDMAGTVWNHKKAVGHWLWSCHLGAVGAQELIIIIEALVAILIFTYRQGLE